MTSNFSPLRRVAPAAGAVLCVCVLATGAAAAQRETLYDAVYCFEAADFADSQQLTGIFLTEVPAPSVGKLCYGNRVLQAGDVLPASALTSLTLRPVCTGDQEAAVCYLPITEEGLGETQTVSISISSGENHAPTAQDGTLETYKNIANDGTLDVTDPEGDSLRYELTGAPKRGEVELRADGTYTYTPANNKVGSDRFTYTVTDAAGNVSNEATVEIEILKPMDKITYSDMEGDGDHFTALWLRERQLFSGESVGGTLCFNPNKAVTRGEFLVMLSQLTELKPDDAQMTSGFDDESLTPAWMRPYIVSALRAGYISGTTQDDGVVFRPTAELTAAEAAVMVQNVLQLPAVTEVSGQLADESVPAWAAEAVCALDEAGLPVAAYDEIMTRRDAANLLYATACLLEDRMNEEPDSLF